MEIVLPILLNNYLKGSRLILELFFVEIKLNNKSNYIFIYVNIK